MHNHTIVILTGRSNGLRYARFGPHERSAQLHRIHHLRTGRTAGELPHVSYHLPGTLHTHNNGRYYLTLQLCQPRFRSSTQNHSPLKLQIRCRRHRPLFGTEMHRTGKYSRLTVSNQSLLLRVELDIHLVPHVIIVTQHACYDRRRHGWDTAAASYTRRSGNLSSPSVWFAVACAGRWRDVAFVQAGAHSPLSRSMAVSSCSVSFVPFGGAPEHMSV